MAGARARRCFYGAGTAFFDPSSDAIVPDLLPDAVLAQANSLDQFVRPIALRMVGPALGGILVQTIGAGGAFALDAASFAVSGATLLALLAGPRRTSRAKRASASSVYSPSGSQPLCPS